MEILLILALVFGASVFGTVSGFGISTIMLPVLLIFYPRAETLLLVGIIHWCNDIWKILLFRKGIVLWLIVTFGLTGIAASYFGASLAFMVDEILFSKIIGCFLLAYVIFILLKPSFKLTKTKRTALIGGGFSGFLAGVSGMGGTARSAFLTSFDLPKPVYIATGGAIAFLIDITRLGTYLYRGARVEAPLLFGLVVFIPASFLGAKLGRNIVGKIPQKHFRKVIAIFLLLVGIKLLLTT